KQRQRAASDRVTMMLSGTAFILIGGGGLAAWLLWGYLQTGVWAEMTPRTMLRWSFASDMVGLQNIVNWFLDQWIGWYPIVFGALVFWAGTQESTYY
ncbi:MAG: hypothetical protein ABI216_21580, partial [Devosia sp.]